MIIGIDFDNTIVCYDRVFHEKALALGLIEPRTSMRKTSVKNRIQELYGDIAWQRLQAVVYGQAMHNAQMFDGVREFFSLCAEKRTDVRIVSHKTEFANYDETRTNLRRASLDWMEANGFFNVVGMGLRREDVFFEASREDKVQRISQLGCTHFIDDLETVLTHKQFNPAIVRILFAPEQTETTPSYDAANITVCSSWQTITKLLFGK
jgi:hypothetical protein